MYCQVNILVYCFSEVSSSFGLISLQFLRHYLILGCNSKIFSVSNFSSESIKYNKNTFSLLVLYMRRQVYENILCCHRCKAIICK